jgi:hypothetical protein
MIKAQDTIKIQWRKRQEEHQQIHKKIKERKVII